ncbi:MAG TPA: glycosyltransferase family 1 protein, partial [Verrucomicrobiae bacterium]|nr:glycosyltransferase family 1 protein [Verrucomicrobiae bacterium]
MRFLMLNWRDPANPKAGGAERVSEAYMAELVKRGHAVCWFSNAFPGCAETELLNGISIVRKGGYGSSILAARKWFRSQGRFDL